MSTNRQASLIPPRATARLQLHRDFPFDAALAFIGRTPAPLALAPMEDLIGSAEQPNVPGTTDEHPNWRRRLPADSETLLRSDEVERRIAILHAARQQG